MLFRIAPDGLITRPILSVGPQLGRKTCHDWARFPVGTVGRGTESNATCEKYHFFDPHRPYQHNLPVREHCAERCWPVKPQPASSTAIASRPDQLVPRGM